MTDVTEAHTSVIRQVSVKWRILILGNTDVDKSELGMVFCNVTVWYRIIRKRVRYGIACMYCQVSSTTRESSKQHQERHKFSACLNRILSPLLCRRPRDFQFRYPFSVFGVKVCRLVFYHRHGYHPARFTSAIHIQHNRSTFRRKQFSPQHHFPTTL